MVVSHGGRQDSSSPEYLRWGAGACALRTDTDGGVSTGALQTTLEAGRPSLRDLL